MKSTMFLMVGTVVVLGSLSMGAVISDNFDTDHNYLVDGTAGTVWDGFVYNGGLDSTQDTVVTAAAATGGGFNLQSSKGNWEGGNDDGSLLFIDVAAGSDFVASVFISDYTYVHFHDVGLMAMVGGTQDYVMARHFDQWGVANRLRSTDDGVTNNGFDPHPDGITPYLQLEKAGAVFTLRVSFDSGLTYEDVGSVERLDMENEALRVGLYQATFSGNVGNVTFDDFSLTVVPEPATMALLGLGSLMAVRRKRVK